MDYETPNYNNYIAVLSDLTPSLEEKKRVVRDIFNNKGLRDEILRQLIPEGSKTLDPENEDDYTTIVRYLDVDTRNIGNQELIELMRCDKIKTYGAGCNGGDSLAVRRLIYEQFFRAYFELQKRIQKVRGELS